MALQAFVDDSGGTEQNQHPYFVLAGLLADTSRWAEFSADWKSVLDEEPHLEYFKMSEANALQGQFGIWRGWARASRDVRVDRFVEVVRAHAIFRFSVAINKAEFYNQIATIELPNAPATAGNPYYLAFHKLVLGLPLRQALNKPSNSEDAKVDFIFDEQGVSGSRASDAWNNVKLNVLPKMKMDGVPDILPFIGSPPIYRNEKEFLPLQAADLYAWHVRKHRQNNRVLIAPPSPRFARLCEIPGDDSVFDSGEIMGLRRDILEALMVLRSRAP